MPLPTPLLHTQNDTVIENSVGSWWQKKKTMRNNLSQIFAACLFRLNGGKQTKGKRKTVIFGVFGPTWEQVQSEDRHVKYKDWRAVRPGRRAWGSQNFRQSHGTMLASCTGKQRGRNWRFCQKLKKKWLVA